MKQIIAGVLLAAAVLTGCQNTEGEVSIESTESQQGAESIDLSDLGAVQGAYIDPLGLTSIVGRSWSSPGDLDPDDILVTLEIKVLGEPELRERYAEDDFLVFPQDYAESYAEDCFGLGGQLLQKAEAYDSETQSYRVEIGLGGAWDVQVTGAEQQEDLIHIRFDLIDGSGLAKQMGEMSIQLLDGGGHRYISNTVESKNLTELPAMSAESAAYSKYLLPAQYTLIRYPFTEAALSGEDGQNPLTADGWGTLAMLAEDFYRIDADGVLDETLYADFWKNGQGGFPQAFLEGAIQKHLRLPSGEIRKAFGEIYSPEQERYLLEDGRGGPGYTTAIVTGVYEQEGTLELSYDAYRAFPDDQGESELYAYDFSGQLTVEIDGDAFYYTRNQRWDLPATPATERYADDELPENTPQNQAYVDRYIYPFAVTGLFGRNFSHEDMSELLTSDYEPPLKTIFNALYNYDYPESDLRLTDYDTEVPAEIFEGVLTAHFRLTQEQVRQSCAQYYDAEKDVYTAAFGLGGGEGVFIITDSSLEGNALTLHYDQYARDYDRPSGEGAYPWMLIVQGELQLEVDGEDYRFISNQYTDIE